jgi:hypothetical protein
MPPEGMTDMGAAPPGAAAPPPQAPPTGDTGATMPVPNRGLEAATLAVIHGLLTLMQQASMRLPVGSESWRDIHEAMTKIAKHMPVRRVLRGDHQHGDEEFDDAAAPGGAADRRPPRRATRWRRATPAADAATGCLGAVMDIFR